VGCCLSIEQQGPAECTEEYPESLSASIAKDTDVPSPLTDAADAPDSAWQHLASLAHCCFGGFAPSCMAVLGLSGELWVGGDGVVVVFSLEENDVVSVIRTNAGRCVGLVQCTGTMAGVMETGVVCCIDTTTHALAASLALLSTTVSAAHLSAAHLWAACPISACVALWEVSGQPHTPLVEALRTAHATFVRVVLFDDGGICLEVHKKRLPSVSAGKSPLIVECVASIDAHVFLACTGMLLAVSPGLELLHAWRHDREWGRVTALLPLGGSAGVLAGTQKGVLAVNGERVLTLPSRVVCARRVAEDQVLCVSDCSATQLRAGTMELMFEHRLPSSPHRCIASVVARATVVCLLRDGSVFAHHLPCPATDLLRLPPLPLTGLEAHPHYERAWAMLECIVARRVQGTHLERLVATRISTDGTRRLVTQLITQVVSHDTLALLLRLLCAHATSHSSHAATNHIAVAVRDTWDDVTGSTEPLPSIDDTLSERVRAGVARVAAAQRSAYVEAKACVEACVDGIVGEVLGWTRISALEYLTN